MPTKVHLVKAMVFPVVMYGYESWTIKKAEHKRIDAFELWCWKRLFRVPWTARRSNQSILKEISPEYSLERPIDAKPLLIWKDSDAGKDWRWEEKGTIEDKMVGCHHWLNGHALSKFQELVMTRRPGVLQSMGSQRVGHNWVTKMLNVYIYLTQIFFIHFSAKGYLVASMS